jgi:hypothetical protein
MKKLILFLLTAWSTAGADLNTNGIIRLAWDYPPDELGTNLMFILYSTTNITTPFGLWTVLTNIPGTQTKTTVRVSPGKLFLTLTASNIWGESDPCNTVPLPALPRNDSKITVLRGDK